MYRSIEELLQDVEAKNLPLWQVICMDDCEETDLTEEQSFEKMRQMYQAMKDSITDYDGKLKSASGLVGTDGAKVHERREAGKLLVGSGVGMVMERALMVTESNACMKRIVAAPTAGSCGVLPAVLTSMQEQHDFTDEQMTEALFVAAGIGGVIAHRASLSGAEGGCQAEIGSASAMAAGAATYLMGGTPEQVVHGAALALKGLLGLACDPVAGLVEVPCVKRNVIGSVNSMTSADLALSGITSRIPPDQVIDSMRSIGHMMNKNLKETGEGGLAATPAALEIKREISM